LCFIFFNDYLNLILSFKNLYIKVFFYFKILIISILLNKYTKQTYTVKKHIHTVNILFILFITSLNCCGQEVPPVRVFNTEDCGGGNQNWSISQATNKYIYIANNNGLLEYNGEKWSLYPTPNETIMRSVMCIENQIFTGFFRDFGFWEKDEYGFLEFTSIVAQKGIKMFEDEQIWEIIELDGWVLFKSLQRIHLYNLKNKTLKTLEGK
jgi:AraC family chitin signaling transcriptional activator